jgi:hypothetical protein
VTRAAAAAAALSPEEFYAEFTRRNAGVVTERQQRALSTATVLVAGCGSVGGAAVEPLTRLGVRDFVLAEPDTYELNNLNRQQATFRDLGRNKAEVAAERVLAINPHASVRVHAEGVTQENVFELTAFCDLIVDGVDVTTGPGWQAKHALHRSASQRRLPLITGWDMAGVQYVQCYDYRHVPEPFNGLVTEDDLRRCGVWELIFKAIPVQLIPPDMLTEVAPNLTNEDYSVPQVIYAAVMFGAITSHMAARLLAGEEVRDEVHLDLHEQVRPATHRRLNRAEAESLLFALRQTSARGLGSPDAGKDEQARGNGEGMRRATR